MIRNLLFVLILGLSAACSAAPGNGESLPALEGTWSITLTQSGGFAGLQRTVIIANDGSVVAVDERERRIAALQLSEAELTGLEEQLSAARVIRPTETETGCADCFIYDLRIDSASESFSIQLDDVTLPDSGLQPLVANVRDLMERALATQ